jgi:hypothetical protein
MGREIKIIKDEIEKQIFSIKEKEKELKKLKEELKEAELEQREEAFLGVALTYKHFMDEQNRKPKKGDIVDGIDLSLWLSRMKNLKQLTPKMLEALEYLQKRIDKLGKQYDIEKYKNRESISSLLTWIDARYYSKETKPKEPRKFKPVSPEEVFVLLRKNFTDIQIEFMFLRASGMKNAEIARILSIGSVDHIQRNFYHVSAHPRFAREFKAMREEVSSYDIEDMSCDTCEHSKDAKFGLCKLDGVFEYMQGDAPSCPKWHLKAEIAQN